MSIVLRTIFLLLLCERVCDAQTPDQIVEAIYRHPNECKDPSDGGIWAPQAGCGGGSCNFPNQWCSAKSQGVVPQLKCVDLPPDCKKSLQNDQSQQTGATTTGATATSGAPATSGASATSGAPATTSGTPATTVATTEATSAPAPSPSPQPSPSTGTTGGAKATTSSPGSRVKIRLCCGPGVADINPDLRKNLGQGANGANMIQVPLGGGPSPFGPIGGAGANGANKVKIPVGGPSPFGPIGGAGGNSSSVQTMPLSGQGGQFGGGGSQGASKPNMVSIPVGMGGRRRRRHAVLRRLGVMLKGKN